jgi:hypothetical protein
VGCKRGTRVKGKYLMEELPRRKRGGSRSGRKIVRLPLTSLSGLIKEAGRVYRRMKDGKMEHEHGRSLVWVLDRIRGMLEAQALERMEQRLNELGEHAGRMNGNGRPATIEHARLPH